VAVAVVAGVLSVPGFPGHAEAALGAELAVSDAGVVNPFAADPPPDDTCGGLETAFGVGNHLFKDSGVAVYYASIWPIYAALGQLYVASLLPGHAGCAADFAATVGAVDANYWDGTAFDQGPRPFHLTSDLPRVDDSLWMGLADMADGHLARAEAVFDLAVADWDPHGGGVYWEKTGAGGQERAVVSNAPAVLLGVDLYRRTGRERYLRWSEDDLAWLKANLLDPTDGLYDDHVDGRRAADRAVYTYTQGIVVGAMAALSTVDPTAYPLAAAVALADRAIGYFATHHTYGDPGFDVVWAENVLGLAARYGHPAFTARAVRSVRAAAAAEPADPSDLLDTSADATLGLLTRLPATDYGRLWYTVATAPGRPSAQPTSAPGTR